MKKKQFSVILPIKSLEASTLEYLKTALESLLPFQEDVKLVVVTPNKGDIVISSVIRETIPDFEYELILNKGPEDFCSQVNLGVNKIDTKWFSILEIDDKYAPTWFKNVEKYIDAYPDVDVFLPVVADVDDSNVFLSFTNESVWALGFSETQGSLDNECLMEYQNFQISGAVYNTEKYNQYGGLKSNIKLSYGLEMLLRFTHNNLKIMTVPKIGYMHTNMRVDSIFWNYKNDETLKLSVEEAKFWMDIAKKEFYFTENREVTYSEAV